ncbi:phosphate-selective porin O/P [Prosthecobacter fusiformis]|uniref:Phosphate-selective porin O/P n=1 Tax=Prosthecobacter fusiformis TaxID=48464 RepID=A0A4R7RKF5_9BACT|nr:porin [Prosthecobacter fusiformis]TDU64095.1 phosphate-selective porin O/P [Prosthecobacter fusiformis]
MTVPSPLQRLSLLLLLLALLLSPAHPGSAGEAPPTFLSATLTAPSPRGDPLENLGRLYKNDANDYLQELWLLGRYHGHYHWSQGSAGEDEGHEVRRFRLGAQAQLLHKLTLHAQMLSGSDLNPFYNGFTELWVQWGFTPKIALTLGQQKHRFSHDRNISSRYIHYLERSMLTNMFAADYTPAATLQGKIGPVTYYTGLFSNATSRQIDEAFTQFDSGYSYLAAAYINLGHRLRTETAHLHLTALHSQANENATNLNRFDNGLSTALILTQGSAALVTELTAGLGSDEGDAYGLNIQPSYYLTDNLQLALRYQIAASNGPLGLQAQSRYETPAGLPRGDLYQAGYIGLNYHIAKHRLKLMTGLEYATMGGESVWTASTMIRFFFGPHSSGPYPMNQILHGHFLD